MAKPKVSMACTDCGNPARQWSGRCPGCGAWGTIAEHRDVRPEATPKPLILADERPEDRLPTRLQGFDRVLGGGMVPGSVILVAGEPGIGKSTLLLQVAANLSASGYPCLYASGEESRAQVASRARRLALSPDAVPFVEGRDLPSLVDAIRATAPSAVIVDSIQAIRDPALTALPGLPVQVRSCADVLVGVAKADGIAVILAGQVTKDGEVAGPRTLEHAVDAVCTFDGDGATGLRVLAGGKNRFGPEGEVAWFEMGAAGLREVDPRDVLGTSPGEPGAATALVAAGRRGLAVEVQALAVPGEGPGRRNVAGLDPRRFGVVAAVLDRTLGLRFSRSEIYGAVSGGLRVDDPAADLAVAAALASAARGVAPPPGTAFAGEVGLTGLIRPVSNMAVRLAAAAAAGVMSVYCAGDAAPEPRTDWPPANSGPGERTSPASGIQIVRVSRLADALRWCRAPGDRRPARERVPAGITRGSRDG